MTCLGKELSELRRRYTNRKMSIATTLKIGAQALQAIHDLHEAGFVVSARAHAEQKICSHYKRFFFFEVHLKLLLFSIAI